MKNIMSDDKSDDDIDARMYATFSCVDCGREFQTREELEDHESILIEFNNGINLKINWNLMLFINSWLPIDNVISPTEFHLHTPSYVIFDGY